MFTYSHRSQPKLNENCARTVEHHFAAMLERKFLQHRVRSHGRPLDCAHASNIFESWFNSALGALRCLVPSSPDLPLYCLERTCELENRGSSESFYATQICVFSLASPHVYSTQDSGLLADSQLEPKCLGRTSSQSLPWVQTIPMARKKKNPMARKKKKFERLESHRPELQQTEHLGWPWSKQLWMWIWMISIEHAGRANTRSLWDFFFLGQFFFQLYNVLYMHAFLAQHMGGWDPHVSSPVSFFAACVDFLNDQGTLDSELFSIPSLRTLDLRGNPLTKATQLDLDPAGGCFRPGQNCVELWMDWIGFYRLSPEFDGNCSVSWASKSLFSWSEA